MEFYGFKNEIELHNRIQFKKKEEFREKKLQIFFIRIGGVHPAFKESNAFGNAIQMTKSASKRHYFDTQISGQWIIIGFVLE